MIGNAQHPKTSREPCTPDQAVTDFPNWIHVCGQVIQPNDLKKVSPAKFLSDQIVITRERALWSKNPDTENDSYYYCKSLVWLCFAVNKLSHPKGVFSWQSLIDEAGDSVRPIVQKLIYLRDNNWDFEIVKSNLQFFYDNSEVLMKSLEIISKE